MPIEAHLCLKSDKCPGYWKCAHYTLQGVVLKSISKLQEEFIINVCTYEKGMSSLAKYGRPKNQKTSCFLSTKGILSSEPLSQCFLITYSHI